MLFDPKSPSVSGTVLDRMDTDDDSLFRALCHHIWEVVEDRFPDSRHSAVGSFIFLRFFCPAIVAPENIDLDIGADSRDVRRALLLITKVIQNLANNVVFGNKEPHMKVLNSFLSENIRQVTKFLSDVAVSH
jgi:neurofibromin 1